MHICFMYIIMHVNWSLKKRPLSLDLWLYLRKCMRKNIPKAFHSSYLRKMPCNCDIARSTHYGGFVGSPLRNIILSIDV